ncbi:hypothetical protein TNCV_2649851 [Trichonephila clavipes]|nr:hypothetical protein TNCV_2649851 [Trichonephila clavipes]
MHRAIVLYLDPKIVEVNALLDFQQVTGCGNKMSIVLALVSSSLLDLDLKFPIPSSMPIVWFYRNAVLTMVYLPMGWAMPRAGALKFRDDPRILTTKQSTIISLAFKT